MPGSIIRNGNIITISFNIPVPPLVIDTTLVAARPHYGFEFTQTGGNSVSITDVSLINANSQVQITLSDIPTGTDQKVRYAWSCYDPALTLICADPLQGNHIGGNIRDSDGTDSGDTTYGSGVPLYNWLVAFNQAVTFSNSGNGGGGGGPIHYQCNDGIDNDGDGLIDYPNDPGCSSATDNDETNVTSPLPVCSDGIDNDNDGKIDYPNDPGCVSPTGSSEVDPVIHYQCNDGIDNDGDGLIDYPNDPGCSSATDNDETNTRIQTECTANCTTTDTSSSGNHTGSSNGTGTTATPSKPIIIPQKTEPIKHSDSETHVTPRPQKKQVIPYPKVQIVGIAMALPEIVLSLLRVIQALISLFGVKRKNAWGVVYDSRTKQPIDPAYVTLTDSQGIEKESALTDISGRYGFLVEPGTYTVSAQKTNYTFPSKILTGRKEDELYQDLYGGEPIVLNEKNQIVAKNIPLDQEHFDWNEFQKQKHGLTVFFAKHDVFLNKLSRGLFWFGYIATVAVAFHNPTLLNILMCVLYSVVEVLNLIGISSPRTATVIGRDGQPLKYALVEIYNATVNQLITKKATTDVGRFYALVPKGKYYAKIFQRNPSDTTPYTEIFTSNVFSAPSGHIHRQIRVR